MKHALNHRTARESPLYLFYYFVTLATAAGGVPRAPPPTSQRRLPAALRGGRIGSGGSLTVRAPASPRGHLILGRRGNPGIEPRFPSLQADSLLAEPQGKPKNTGVGSLSLLQQIFPTQESTWGLLHCRRILDQLSSQGSPLHMVMYMFQCYCLSWSHPLLPRCAHKFVLQKTEHTAERTPNLG